MSIKWGEQDSKPTSCNRHIQKTTQPGQNTQPSLKDTWDPLQDTPALRPQIKSQQSYENRCCIANLPWP